MIRKELPDHLVNHLVALAKNEHALDIRDDGTYTIDGVPHTDDEILKRSTVVYIEEEYGYRYWVWFTPFTKEELTHWWGRLDSVMRYFYHAADTLPGLVLESIPCAPEEYIKSWGGRLTEEERENVRQYIEGMCRPTYGEALSQSGVWKCHLHTDDDSWLSCEDKTYYHAGFETEDMDENHPVVKRNAQISEESGNKYLRTQLLEKNKED